MSKVHILYKKKIFSDGREYTELRDVYSSEHKAYMSKDSMVNAYAADDNAESVIPSMYSFYYPQLVAEVRFNNGDRYGFWVESHEVI